MSHPPVVRDPSVSVTIPVFNEEAVLPELLRRVGSVLDQIPGGPHEMVFVDDGSSDRSLTTLEAAATADDRIVVVALSRNFGHQAAITAGLDHVRGDVIVVMDADLQDTPEVIPEFIENYAEGYDVVYARRNQRREHFFLRASYYVFYRLLARISTLQLPVDAGDFGLMSRRVVEEVRRAPERNRYLRGLRTWAGFQQIGISVDRAARRAGHSKYTLVKLLQLAFDGIFSFSIVPLRAAAVIGAMALVLSTMYAAYALVAKIFFDQSPVGFTALILVITFVSGVNLFFLGVVGEYVGRIYEEVKARPTYVIDKLLGRH